MKYGIKVGPKQQSVADIKDVHPDFVEVWYDGTHPSEYDELFSYLDDHHIETGLHYWTKPYNRYFPTISLPHSDITDQTVKFIQESIDVASEHHFSYVNIHPGSRARVLLDYEHEIMTVESTPAPLDDSLRTFLTNAQVLNDYAKDRSVIFTIESAAPNNANHWMTDRVGSRYHAFPTYEMPYEALKRVSQLGVAIANDFGHTLSMYEGKNPSPEVLWKFLSDETDELFDATKLIHVSFIIPPYTGVDFHDQLDNPLLETNVAVPNKIQLKNLLRRFIKRSDVWALVEPVENHPKNYRLLRDLVET